MPAKSNKNIVRTDFIDFLSRNFGSRKITRAPAGKKNVRLSGNNAQKKEITPKIVLPVKTVNLKTVLRTHLPETEPDIDIEERMVGEWLRLVFDFIRQVFSGAWIRKRTPSRRPSFFVPVFRLLFSVSEKSKRAKFETEARLIERPWVAKLVVSGLIALFLAVTLGRFTPKLSRNITGRLDQILLYPIITIAIETSPDLKDLTLRSGADTGIGFKAISPALKARLAAYIVRHKPENKDTVTGRADTIKVSEEDLRGRVAGAAEEFIPEEPTAGLIAGKSPEERYLHSFYEDLRLVFYEIAEKQRTISRDLNDRLITYIFVNLISEKN